MGTVGAHGGSGAGPQMEGVGRGAGSRRLRRANSRCVTEGCGLRLSPPSPLRQHPPTLTTPPFPPLYFGLGCGEARPFFTWACVAKIPL